MSQRHELTLRCMWRGELLLTMEELLIAKLAQTVISLYLRFR